MNSKINLSRALGHPSAFLPIIMSILAVLVILTHIVRFGLAPQPDESTSAHLWQLLMASQIPIIMIFAIRWLPESPRSSLVVLALQAAAGIVALAPIYFFHW